MSIDILVDATAITARNDGLGYYSRFFAARIAERFSDGFSVGVVISPSARALGLTFARAEVLVTDHERYSGCIYDAAYLDDWDRFVAARAPRLYVSTAFVPTRVDCARAVVVHDVAPIVLAPMLRPEKVAVFTTLIARTLALSDVVLCASEFTARQVATLAGGHSLRLQVLYPDIAAMMRRVDGPETEPHGRYVVIGVKCPRKNVALVLDALELLSRAERSDVGVYFIGSERDEVPLRSWVKSRNLSQMAEVCGHVTDGELVRLLHGARALIMPSVHEGFGMPVVEALAAGTPVISAGAAAVREVAGEAAVYVSSDAAALARVLTGTHRRQRPEMAQRIAALHTMNERQFESFFDWCESTLSRGRSSCEARHETAVPGSRPAAGSVP